MAEVKVNRSFKPVIERAIEVARIDHAADVQPEHLLQAVANDRSCDAAVALREQGLTAEALAGALRHEREAALAFAGIGMPAEDMLRAAPRLGRPGWGSGTREAVVNSKHAMVSPNGKKRSAEMALTISLLSVRRGRVARALELAGIDRTFVVARMLET